MNVLKEDIFSESWDENHHEEQQTSLVKNNENKEVLEELFPESDPEINGDELPKEHIVLQSIGLNEKIYKFTDLYLPASQQARKRYENCIDLHSSTKILKEFQQTCTLPRPDLNEAITFLRKKVKGVTDTKNNDFKKIELKPQLEVQVVELTKTVASNIESVEFFNNIIKEIEFEWRKPLDKVFEDHTSLLKSVDQTRKELIEQEQQKRLKEALKKRATSNKISFDALMRSDNQAIMTPTFGFGFDKIEEQEEVRITTYDKVKNYFNRTTSPKLTRKITDEDHRILAMFKEYLRLNQGPQRPRLHHSQKFTQDLLQPCFFVYNLMDNEDIKLSLDIYCKNDNKSTVDYNLKFYRQNFINTSDNELFIRSSTNCPFIDCNEKYSRASLEYFGEAEKPDEKMELSVVIDQGKGTNWERDAMREQKAMKVKKMTRLANAQHNKLTGIPEENRREILENTQSDFRKAFDLDKIQDFNKNEEIVVMRKRKSKPIYHSRVADEFILQDFLFPVEKMLNLYRSDFASSLLRDIIFTPRSSLALVVNRGISQRLRLKLNIEKIVEPHRLFDSIGKLSLRTDSFLLIEYIEKDPLILGDIGMGSRLERLIYPTRLSNHIITKHFEDELKKGDDFLAENRQKLPLLFNKTVKEEFGPLGEDVFLVETERIPFIGQLTITKYSGILLLDSNLASTPIFYQEYIPTDFVLVSSDDRNERKYFLRKIETIYVGGQIEPKQEIFSPHSRQHTSFQGKLLRFYIKIKFETENKVDLQDLRNVFVEANEQTLRRQIKGMGGEEESDDKHIFVQKKAVAFEQMEISDESELRVTPEEVCLYERMRQSMAKLHHMGILEIKSTDKIGVLKSKFYKKHIEDSEKTLIAKRILEEVQLTAWNISQSFLLCRQGQARMYLVGFGDPTNGHGGINFIKLPLKMSRYESTASKNLSRLKLQTTVTGTNADLRSLRMKFVHPELRKYGVSEDILNALERWDKIDLLKRIANERAENKTDNSEADEIIKFARNQRMTTEKQKEKYQTDINNMFMKMIDTLSNRNYKHIHPKANIIFEESFEKLLREQKEELVQSKKLNDATNGHHISRTRNPKQKSIVLRHCIKK